MARYLISANLSPSTLRERLNTAGYAVVSIQTLPPSATMSLFEVEILTSPVSASGFALEMSKIRGVSRVLPVPDAE